MANRSLSDRLATRRILSTEDTLESLVFYYA